MRKPMTPEEQFAANFQRLEQTKVALDEFEEKDDEDQKRAKRLETRINKELALWRPVLDAQRTPSDNEMHSLIEAATSIESECVDAGVLERMPAH